MAEQVSELGDIMADAVEGPGEQVPQVVGEHLGGRDPSQLADRFHLCTDLLSGQPCTVSGEKDLAGSGFLFFGVFQELFSQLARQQDGADLAFERDLGPALACGLDRDILHLGDADAGGADGFHEQGKALLTLGVGGLDQTDILVLCQLPVRAAEQTALELEGIDAAGMPTHEVKEAVERHQHGIDGGGVVDRKSVV